MTPIKSICIPRIEKTFDAKLIADIFDRNGIAQVSRVYIEHYNNINNRAYIEIKYWKDTEVAYHFIERLRNPNREARLVYNDDNWWPVIISNFKSSTEDYEFSQRQYRNKSMYKREHLLQELDETAEEFNGYLCKMYNDRELWFSEQYIYDELGM